MRSVVYSVCTGTARLPPPASTDAYPHLLFTDQPGVQVTGWDVRVIPKTDMAVKLSRRYKIKFFEAVPDFDESIYVDTKLRLKNVDALFEYGRARGHIVAMRHAYRICVYDELRAIMKMKKAPVNMCTAQLNRYMMARVPAKAGLWACGIIYRRHTPEAEAFSRHWWNEFKIWPYRDQPSFAVASYALRKQPGTFPGHHRTRTLWKVVCT